MPRIVDREAPDSKGDATVTDNIKVTIGEIDNLAQRLRDRTRDMNDTLDRLDADVAELKNAWSGAALEAYEVAQREWRVTMGDIKETLEQLGTQTALTATNYENTSTSVGNVWGR
ncbi:MAG: WXG100 family type VII secretion target [Microbacteriaceae bacterium]